MADIVAAAGAHQTGDWQRQDLSHSGGSHAQTALVLDEGVDGSGERFVVGADGDDVMRVVGYGRGDGALLKFEIFDEGDGGFGRWLR